MNTVISGTMYSNSMNITVTGKWEPKQSFPQFFLLKLSERLLKKNNNIFTTNFFLVYSSFTFRTNSLNRTFSFSLSSTSRW
jgi:hypothetical protein